MDKQQIRAYLGRETTLIGASAVFVIASFLPYWGVSGSTPLGGGSASVDAWHSYATVGVLLVIAAIAVHFARARGVVQVSDPRIGIGVLAAAGLGVLLVILRALTEGGPNVSGTGYHISSGPSWGYFILVIAGLITAAGLWIAHQRTGE